MRCAPSDLLKNLLEENASSSEVLRLIKQNSISINHIKKSDKDELIQIIDIVVKVGKRRYFKG